MKEIKLSQQGKRKGKYVALVSNKDYARVAKHRWHAQLSHMTVYAVCKGKRNDESIMLHRFVLKISDPNLAVDHRDRNGLNCQRRNLRIATVSENNRNTAMRRSNKSGFKGVYWHKDCEKWAASIRANHKHISLGYYSTPEEASKAYNKAAKKYHGAFASF